MPDVVKTTKTETKAEAKPRQPQVADAVILVDGRRQQLPAKIIAVSRDGDVTVESDVRVRLPDALKPSTRPLHVVGASPFDPTGQQPDSWHWAE